MPAADYADARRLTPPGWRGIRYELLWECPVLVAAQGNRVEYDLAARTVLGNHGEEGTDVRLLKYVSKP